MAANVAKKAAGRSAREIAGMAFFGSVSAGTAYLGWWQVERYNWKVNLMAERKGQLSRDPVPLAESTFTRFEKVKCAGTFHYDQSMLVGPRHAPKASSAASGGMGTSGFLVVTPFTVDAPVGKTILVNRGWAARLKTDVAFERPPAEQAEERVEIEAVIAEDEVPGMFTPDANATTGTFFALESKTLAQARGLPEDTYIVEQINGSGPLLTKTTDSFLQVKVHPATHGGYAVTWFGVSGAALFIIKKLFLR